jgi:hypothetical protein
MLFVVCLAGESFRRRERNDQVSAMPNKFGA